MRIKSLRERLNLTQQEIADQLGVDRSNVSRWENGASVPRTPFLPAIAKLLKCTIEDLYGEED